MKKINTVVDHLVARIIGSNAMKEYKAFEEWNTVVGEVLAQNSVPVKVVNGVLYVSVKNSVWRQEISMQKPQILKKYRERYGMDIIKDIQLQ